VPGVIWPIFGFCQCLAKWFARAAGGVLPMLGKFRWILPNIGKMAFHASRRQTGADALSGKFRRALGRRAFPKGSGISRISTIPEREMDGVSKGKAKRKGSLLAREFLCPKPELPKLSKQSKLSETPAFALRPSLPRQRHPPRSGDTFGCSRAARWRTSKFFNVRRRWFQWFSMFPCPNLGVYQRSARRSDPTVAISTVFQAVAINCARFQSLRPCELGPGHRQNETARGEGRGRLVGWGR
jgi:hypothetical protein